jgi:hypothetical protein
MPFDGVTQNPVVQRLLDAKSYLQEHGWCQWRVQDPDGRVCTIGGVIYGSGNLCWQSAYQDSSVLLAIRELEIRCGGHIPNWNNTQERTVEDVYKLIDNTIQSLVAETVAV